jgi:hypothetical protein
MLSIKVLGPGCYNCELLEQTALSALDQLSAERPDLQATVVKVTDRSEFMRYGLLFTPGLVINEQLVSAGRIPSEEEIAGWLIETLDGTTT